MSRAEPLALPLGLDPGAIDHEVQRASAGALSPVICACMDAPIGQVVFERLARVIGCGHVSGLSLRQLTQPRAGMAMRGSEVDQQTELVGSGTNAAFPDPDLLDPLPLLFRDLLPPDVPGRIGKRGALTPMSPPGSATPLASSSWPRGRAPSYLPMQARRPDVACVRWPTNICRVRNSMARAGCASVFRATNRLVGRNAASTLASASAAAFFGRLTNGFT